MCIRVRFMLHARHPSQKKKKNKLKQTHLHLRGSYKMHPSTSPGCAKGKALR